MSELVMEIEAHVRDCWLNKAPDIDRMLERTGACGSHFTIVTFAKMDTQSAANILYMLYGDVLSDKGDMATYKRIIVEYLTSLANRLKNYYFMDDAYDVCMRSAVEAAEEENRAALAALVRAVQLYFGQLAYWVDFAIPWKGMSEKYTQLQAEHKNGLSNDYFGEEI